MTYQTAIIIILLIFNILLAADAWWMTKLCNKAERKAKELDDELAKEKANNRFVVPVAEFKEIKFELSEEDVRKIEKTLKNWRTIAGREAEHEDISNHPI